MESGYVTSQGLRLYYEIEGAGPALIMLNGGPGFSHEYLEATKVLAADARLVYFDQRGTGRSDKADPRDYTVAANVADVENLRQALGLGPCGVFGHSWGGMLAQAYALEHPKSVTRLVLADTFSSAADVDSALARMRAAVPAEVQAVYDRYESEGLYKDGDHYPAEYQAAVEVAYAPVFLSVPPPAYLLDMFAQVAGDVYRAMWGEESEFRVTGTLAAFDVESRLPAIRVPTLVLVGASDMPTVAMAEKTARLIPQARLAVFAHSRHFPFIEEPQAFAQEVGSFLRETAS